MENIGEIVKAQRAFFDTGKTLDYEFRMLQMKKLKRAVKLHEAELLKALKKDLHKPDFEAYAAEIGMFLEEAGCLMARLKDFMDEEYVKTSLMNFPSSSRILYEPYGVALVMSPWNYPILLSLDPLIGALAAGNCVILKPSDESPQVSSVLKRILNDIFPEEYVAVVEGGSEESQYLLSQKFDYIFFTGSVRIGKLVMEAAAKNLTPVSLELGGKSPCIVDETANLKLAAKRIVWGKYLNAGQTCVAPDYVLVQQSVKKELIFYMKGWLRRFYGEDFSGWKDYTRIVNGRHYERLMNLIEGEKAVIGGHGDPDGLCIEPTILDNVSWNSPVMQEEIFGPVLPVLTFQSLSEVIVQVRRRPKPLAAYLFTRNPRNERMLLNRLSFGGGCINDTVMHLGSTALPFGGVGESGMGAYHGRYSFETFSHAKGILKKACWLDLPFRYPPYKKSSFSIVKKILK